MTQVRFISVDGEGEFAVVPLALWNRLLAKAECVADAEPVQVAPANPPRVRDDIREGVHPLKAWRQYRCMTTAELATAADVSTSFVTLIETGRRSPSPRVLDRLAVALDAPQEALEKKLPSSRSSSRCITCGREPNQ